MGQRGKTYTRLIGPQTRRSLPAARVSRRPGGMSQAFAHGVHERGKGLIARPLKSRLSAR